MPYKLRKAPKKDLYWVVNKDTGKKHSTEPLPKSRAEAQMRALYAVESGYTLKGKGDDWFATLPSKWKKFLGY